MKNAAVASGFGLLLIGLVACSDDSSSPNEESTSADSSASTGSGVTVLGAGGSTDTAGSVNAAQAATSDSATAGSEAADSDTAEDSAGDSATEGSEASDGAATEAETAGSASSETAPDEEGSSGEETDSTDDEASADIADLEPFSFFVTSLEIMRELSGSQDGFGGDLGGLEGADSICQQAAERVGFGAKTWRAFLSATDGGDGQPVHAIDRVGEGPWYDRNGRLVAEDISGLLNERPAGDPQTVNDLPNEHGEGLKQFGDTHDIITGTNAQGQLDATDASGTCNDWTSTTVVPSGGSSTGGGGRRGRGGDGGGGVRLGHSWPANSGMNWMTAHTSSSCAAGVNLAQTGGGDGSSIGSGGGYGGIYCFALTP